MGDYPLQIIIDGTPPLDANTLKKAVIRKLGSSGSFSSNTFPIRNLAYQTISGNLTCSGDSNTNKPCLNVTVTIFNVGSLDVPEIVKEALHLIQRGLESCIPDYAVIVNPKFDPSYAALTILRKIEEIKLENFEKVKEELYRELGVPAGGSLQLKSKL
ncbi:uncharacterized protein LOC135337655 [Halichondria panicea]|uniref:uncharacterized protein LOC135337655 n=1 Tax=Halichondria panicea TaxID=6063 RepID=UPI00312BA244